MSTKYATTPFDYAAAPETAVLVSIAYGDTNWGYLSDGEAACSTCDKRPAVVTWDGGMDSAWECAECLQESMRQSDLQTWLAHPDITVEEETHVTPAAQAWMDKGAPSVLTTEQVVQTIANHRWLVDNGYPYGGDFIHVDNDGLVEVWFQGAVTPCTVETIDEYRESVFCWSNDC